jgi:hypothetical protein
MGGHREGVAFELVPPNSSANPVSYWTEEVIHAFRLVPNFIRGGRAPNGLIIDSNGVLYGTTHSGGYGGGLLGLGTVFEILPPLLSTTGEWETVILHRFGGVRQGDGSRPAAALLLDPAASKLYGTTGGGGTHNRGTVFPTRADQQSEGLGRDCARELQRPARGRAPHGPDRWDRRQSVWHHPKWRLVSALRDGIPGDLAVMLGVAAAPMLLVVLRSIGERQPMPGDPILTCGLPATSISTI